MVRRRLIWQLFPAYVIVALIAVAAAGGYASRSLRLFYLNEKADDLEAVAFMVKTQIEDILKKDDYKSLDKFCKQIGQAGKVRITVILPSGKVVADSDENPGEMAPHNDRPEIIQALATGRGQLQRYSETLNKHMIYVAILVKDADEIRAVLRTSLPITAIYDALETIYKRIFLGGLIVALCVAGVCLIISRRIAKPIEQMEQTAQRYARGELDVSVPMPNNAMELAALANSMNEMARQLRERIETVTEQRNELEAVLSSMVEGVLAVDNQGNVMTINQSASQLLYATPQKIQGHSIYGIVRNVELNRFIEKTLQSEQTTEAQITLPVQGGRYLHLHGASISDVYGKKSGAVIVLNDMTHMRRLENLRRDFVANVSHELKTPVTSIKGFVEALREGGLGDKEQSKKFLDIIGKQSERLNAIIEDLLSLSRIEEGTEKGRITLRRENLRPTVESAVELTQIRAQEKNIEVVITDPYKVEAEIDAALIEQALVNLIDNAIKYSTEGNRIEVIIGREDGYVTISVKDNGCGIDREHLSRLFERFYVVDKARSRKLGGTGLGLAIVKHIAVAHGGRVSVESTLEQGSTFTIHLPGKLSSHK